MPMIQTRVLALALVLGSASGSFVVTNGNCFVDNDCVHSQHKRDCGAAHYTRRSPDRTGGPGWFSAPNQSEANALRAASDKESSGNEQFGVAQAIEDVVPRGGVG